MTHENVCRLFDLGRHQAEDPGHESLYFVTMEFLAGETLRDRIRRRGRLELEESLEIASQVARGIRAAHRQGVIHRDIKGSNVLLVEQPDGSTRAVVTDFGLALQVPSTVAGDTAPLPSCLEGTPLFMAPEQVVGEVVSQAADIYSFGILLYHMVTGGWPFEGATAISMALARIEQEPTPPRRHLADLDPGLEAVILRCLERQPSARFPSMEHLLGAIEQILRPPEGQPKARPRGWQRWPVWAAFGILVPAVLVLGWLASGQQAESNAVTVEPVTVLPTAEVRPSLAIVPFRAKEEDPYPEGLGIALSEGIASLLAAGEGLRVINVDDREELRTELPPVSGSIQELAEIEQIDAAWTLQGSFQLRGSQLRGTEFGSADQNLILALDLRLESRQGQPVVHSFALAGSLDRLGEIIAQAGARVCQKLRLASPTALQIESASVELPHQTATALLYAQGLAALREFDAIAARGKLEAALEQEPEHPLILNALSEVLSRLGYSQQSAQVAEQAFRHAGGLSREQQLAVEARYRLRFDDWGRAEELFRALHEFFPDDLDYGLNLTSAQARGARLEAAFATLDRLRHLPQPWGADPRLDLAEAKIAYYSGDYHRSQRSSGRAVTAARGSGLRLLLARALDQEALTRVYTDSPAGQVEALLEEALALYRQVDHKLGQTEALLTLGERARQRGELDLASAYIRQGLALAEETGNLPSQARGKSILSILHDLHGQLAEGLALKKQLLENYRQRNVRQGAAVTLENIGISLFKMGRPEQALEYFLQAAEQFDQIGDQIGMAWAPYHAGRVWLDLGDLESASNRLEQARQAAVEHSEGGLVDATELELIRIAAARKDEAAAERRPRALIEVFKSHDQALLVAEARLLLAQILASRAKYSQASKLASEVLTFSDLEGIEHTAVEALTVVTQAGLADHNGSLGDLPTLLKKCHALEARLSGLEHRKIVLLAQVVVARCSLSGGSPPAQVTAEARRIATEAGTLGLAEPRLEAACLEAEVLASMDASRVGTVSPCPGLEASPGVGAGVGGAAASAASDSSDRLDDVKR